MDKVDELLTRGVENIIPSKKELEEVLRSGKKLNIYLGIDPTSLKIHIGHGVPLRKLQQFIELGHNITLLFGDFTSKVGDTSDKEAERPRLSDEEIAKNVITYKDQAGKIVDLSKIKIRFNSEWLSKLGLADMLSLYQHFSFNDFLSRELIKKRLEAGGHIKLDEVTYPVMQGYDSYFMDTDVQVGGTDQTFNMQAGRILQKDLRHKESFIIANGFLEGTDGRKMSKSWGNAIWLTDEAAEMYGEVMSLRDDLIIQYFTLATDTPLDRIESTKRRFETGENPMVLKKELAYQIVSELHSPAAARKAQEEFEKTFQERDIAEELIQEVKAGPGKITDRLVEAGIVESKSEAKRLEEQGAIEEIKPGIFRVGKKKFVKFV